MNSTSPLAPESLGEPLGPAPHIALLLKPACLDGRFCKEGYIGHLSKTSPVIALRAQLCNMLGVPEGAVAIMYEGRDMKANKTLLENDVTLPGPARRRAGAMPEFVFDFLFEECQRQRRVEETVHAEALRARREAEEARRLLESQRVSAEKKEKQRLENEKALKEKEEEARIQEEQNRIVLALVAVPIDLRRIQYSDSWGLVLERRTEEIAQMVGVTQKECISRVTVVSAQGMVVELFSSDFVPVKDNFPLTLAVGRVDLPVQVMGPTHNELLKLVRQDARKFPHCWNHEDKNMLIALEDGCPEFTLVTAYLVGTIGYAPHIQSVERVQNEKVLSSFRDTGDLTMMFHGCRAQANEDGILNNGFQVNKCVSGGANYGSWFAYAANYSDSGFVLTDKGGLKHIFICVVTKEKVVLNNVTMRVVGQGCAYPQWLIKYRTPQVRDATR